MTVVRAREFRRYPPASARVERVFARGTVHDVTPSLVEPETTKSKWALMLQLEWLGLNLVVVGALETAYRKGRAHGRFELARTRRVMP